MKKTTDQLTYKKVTCFFCGDKFVYIDGFSIYDGQNERYCCKECHISIYGDEEK